MQVPIYQRQAEQQGLPKDRQTTQVDASNFLGGTTAAALNYGEQAAGDINKAVQHHYEQQLQEARQARILDVSTQLQTYVQDAMYGKTGALSKMGADAFLGSDGRSAMDMVYDDTVKKQNALADTLGDDTQKADFKQQTNSMLMTMRGQLMGHEAQQHRVYVQSTLESSNTAQTNNIALNYNDTVGLQKSIDQIQANSAQLGKLHGYGPEWGAVNAQTSISGALNKVINSALDKGDFSTTQNILKNFAPHMNTDDLVTAYSKMQKAKGEATALSTSFATIEQLRPTLMPNDGDRAFNILLGSESATGQFFNGQPATSQKGAVGAAQVMKDTGPEAAKLAGLPWDEHKWQYDEAYNTAIGKAYFQKQMQTNHGDMQKAYAAYNAGPDALKNAIAQGGDNWLPLLPTETQKYVAKNMDAYNAGAGKPKPATKEDFVHAALNNLPSGSSTDVVKSTMQMTEHLYDLHHSATEQNQDATIAQVYTELDRNGWDISKVPLSLRDQIPKDKMVHIEDYAISKGKVQTDPAIYNRLTEDSAYLAGLRPDQFVAFKAVLSDSDWHTLQSQRKALQNPATDKSPDNLDSAAVTTSVNNLLGQLQIPATGKDADPARLGAIRQYVNTTLLRQQGNEGKHFTEKEIGSRISELFTQTAFTKHFWSPDNNETVLAKNIGDIPDAIKTKIKAAFVKKGIDNPTDGQILGSYFNGMSK